MKKFKKLNAQGVAHDVLIVAFVTIFAIAGVAYLVGSHADVPTKLTASCTINNLSASPAYGQVLSPTATITVSPGSGSYNPNPVSASVYPTKGDRSVGASTVNFPAIAPGASATEALPNYTVGYSSSGSPYYMEYEMWWGDASVEVNCAQQFALPVQPAPLPTASTPVPAVAAPKATAPQTTTAAPAAKTTPAAASAPTTAATAPSAPAATPAASTPATTTAPAQTVAEQPPARPAVVHKNIIERSLDSIGHFFTHLF